MVVLSLSDWISGGKKLDSIVNCDCLDALRELPDKSIDMILCDLPYGITECKWDSIIPLEKLWENYTRIIKDRGAIVLTASQPFTSKLVLSKEDLFKTEIIWQKTRPSNIFNAHKMFMRWHESILVFYKSSPTFNPQMTKGKPYSKLHHTQDRSKGALGRTGEKEGHITENKGEYYPKSVIEFSNDNHESLHPTQKPVELFKYLIKTYSNESDLVLDNCLGSGTTAVACKQLGRHFLGFELDANYCRIADERVRTVPEKLETWF